MLFIIQWTSFSPVHIAHICSKKATCLKKNSCNFKQSVFNRCLNASTCTHIKVYKQIRFTDINIKHL